VIGSQPLIKERSRPLIVSEESCHFGDEKNEGGRYFNLTTNKILIQEISTRFESLDRGEVRTVRLGAPKCRHFRSLVVGRMRGADAQTFEARNHEISMRKSIGSG
jgi:hypothetical protein